MSLTAAQRIAARPIAARPIPRIALTWLLVAQVLVILPHLLHLHEVYRALLKQRSRRGAVDFETTETQIVCDENGRIEKIVPRTRTEAHRLIERGYRDWCGHPPDAAWR